MARFYDPTAGGVLLDGVDLRELSDADLRRAVVMVTQENFMFDGHRRRTTSASAGPGASQAEVEEAARAVGADDFIDALPRGLRHRRGQAAALGCPPVSGSWSPSPGPSWPTRRC